MSPDPTNTGGSDVSCPECGQTMPADSQFCPNCGAEQTQGDDHREQVEDQPQQGQGRGQPQQGQGRGQPQQGQGRGQPQQGQGRGQPQQGQSRGQPQQGQGRGQPQQGQRPGQGSSNMRDKIPGISSRNSTRRNALVGGGYTLLGLFTLGLIASAQDEESTGGGDGGDGGGGDGGGGNGNDNPYPNAWAYDPNTGIVIEDASGEVGRYSTTIEGTARNESEQDYSYVSLDFALYDSTDAKVGDALANISGLSSGQTWRFEAVGTASGDVDTFSIEDFTAY